MDKTTVVETEVKTEVKPRFGWGHLVIVAIIGILIGLIIAILIFMVMYSTRSGFMEYCAHSAPYCTINDYVPDVDTAKKWGYADEKILMIDDLNRLVYIPPRSNTSCIVDHEVNIVIDYPKHCIFDGNDYTQSSHNPAVYTNGVNTVLTRSHCTPISSTDTIVTSGRPALRW